MDGWIKIGTKLDNKQLEKDYKNLQKELTKLKKEEKKLNSSKSKLEVDLASYEEAKQNIREMTDDALKYAQTQNEVNNVLDNESKLLSDLDNKYSKQLGKISEINTALDTNKIDQQRITAEVEKMNDELNDAKGFRAVQQGIASVGKETGKAIKKVAKWALAVFGVRAAYNFVRQSVSTLSQYNEKLATDLEYIRFAMASALQPLIEKIVSWVYKLLQYINMISQAWFGVNLFANATADAMNKTASSAKDVKKSMAGFDEMNTVSSSSSSSTSVGTPSVDLSGIQGEIPGWMQWILDNKDLLISALAGITIGLITLKITLDPLLSLGIGLIIAGIVLAIQGLIDFIKDPSWENFLTILQGIALVVSGIAILCDAWIVALIALGVAIVAYVIQNWDKVKEILGKIGTWIYDNIVLPVWNFIKGLWDTILTSIKNAINVWKGIFAAVVGIITNPFIVAKETILGIFNGIKTFISGFVQVIKSLFNGDIKGVLNGFKTMFKGIMDSLWSIAKAPINLIIGGINALIKGMNKISFDVPDWVPGIGGKSLGFNIKEIPKLKSGGIINMPGRGIPLGIGGEAGREGVIPLTDSQAMEELGSAIGRYITINLTNNTNLDGRTIARQQSKVQANKNFAMNR